MKTTTPIYWNLLDMLRETRGEGGVAIYNVETRSIENVGKFGKLPLGFAANHGCYKMTRKDQVAAAVLVSTLE